MVCIERKIIEERGGKRYVVADITTNAMPATLPSDGTDVDRLTKDDILMPTSTVSKADLSDIRQLGENGQWFQI